MNVNIPAPTGGWNARDDFASMQLNQAIALKNIVPENGYCRSRGGTQFYYDSNTDIMNSGEIGTLVVYDNGLDNILISCVQGDIYNATDPTINIELKTSQGSDKYITMMFNRRLIMCNGFNAPQVFDGETMVDMVATLEDTNGVIQDKSIGDIIGCTQYKGRAFYWIDKEQRFFYADVAGAYQGALKEFDLQSQAKQGGSITSIFTYARDTGSGLDDYLVIAFNTGECLLYSGDDPAVATSWSLVQRHNIGQLVNNRSVCQKGGDNLLVTSEGLLNFSAAIQGISAQDTAHIGSIIVNAFTNNYKVHQYNENWEINYFPEFNFIIVNVPRRPDDNEYKQFVLNTSTGAWCKFENLNATTWTVFNGRLLYGDSSGNIIQAETGTNDNGNYITCKSISAFSHFNAQGVWKKATGLGITCNIPYKKHLAMTVLKDFDRTKPLNLPYPEDPLPEPNASWDTAKWDVDKWDDVEIEAVAIWENGLWDVNTWGGARFAQLQTRVPKKQDVENAKTRTLFYPATGKGYTLAIKTKLHTRTAEFQWYNSIMRLKSGGRK